MQERCACVQDQVGGEFVEKGTELLVLSRKLQDLVVVSCSVVPCEVADAVFDVDESLA